MAKPEIELCDVTIQHHDIVAQVQAAMPSTQKREELANFFKNLGDPTRLGILWALSVHEMCVCDLAALLGMTQSAVSHQLRTLRQARLVRSRREGKVVFYALDDEHPREIMRLGMTHVEET